MGTPKYAHVLPEDRFRGMMLQLGLGAPLADSLESMIRLLVRSRRLMTLSVFFLLGGVVVLSAATRKPCFHEFTAPWHVWKAGHLSMPDGGEASKLRMAVSSRKPQAAPRERLVPSPTFNSPQAAFVPLVNSIIVQIRNFRSPPSRG